MSTADVTLLGATGFVGGLTAQALAERADPETCIRLAGRSADALYAVIDSIGAGAADWDVVQADAFNEADMADLADSSNVVISTAGPYTSLGWNLVSACAQAGTHYVDLTGEVPFMARSIDSLHETARQSGAKIVHACGFDALPSDIAAMLAYDAAAAQDAGPVVELTAQFRALRGGISGGTIASMRGVLEQARTDREVAALLADPYSLSAAPDLDPRDVDVPDMFRPYRDESGYWVCPFLMALTNTRVVRRSLSLRGYEHGPAVYQEMQAVGRSRRSAVVAGGLTVGLSAGFAALTSPGLKHLAARALPAPGDGPTTEALESGKFTLVTRAVTAGGVRVDASIHGYRDPGYALTGVMLSECALCLLNDDLPADGGVLTPATAVGSRIVDRLAGPDFEFALSQPLTKRGD